MSLEEHLARQHIVVPDETLAALHRYRDLLLAGNRRFNLTAITDPDEVDDRLIAESLSLLPRIPQDTRTLLDVGSGGGIPGIPIAIARRSIGVSLLDATAKKVRFLDETATALDLGNVTTLWGRVEDLAHDPAHRERYDIVTARAVARLATLAEYVLPLLRVGGIALLPKGAGAAEELAEAQHAIRTLGGRSQPLYPPSLVVIDKIRPTPASYPRPTGQPSKRPLGAG